MPRFVPYEKLSKRDKKALDKVRRATWGLISPVTRRPDNPKAYNRRKEQRQARDPGVVFA